MSGNSQIIKQAEQYLNKVRLHQYSRKALSNKGSVMDLYFLNLKVSQEIMGMISLFEVIFRNKIHNILSPCNYLNKSSSVMREGDYKEIERVEKKIKNLINSPNNIEGRVLSNLTLGFWCNLFESKKLWGKYLYKIFDKNIRKKEAITEGLINYNLKKIQNIRNKIAHHGRIIFKRDLPLNDYIKAITDTTTWLVSDSDTEFYKIIKTELEERRQNILQLLKDL